MKKTVQIITGLLLAVLGLIAAALLLSGANLPGGFKLYAVLSGSMMPQIKPGSLVIIQKATEYQVGDVITFKNTTTPITHRIAEIKDLVYITKGDANVAIDSKPVLSSEILGKTIFSLPWLGWPITIAKTEAGFILLIVIPGTVIVYSEILNIKKEIKKICQKHKKNK